MGNVQIYDKVEQGTHEWHALRCGCITASCFKDVMAKGQGKTRKNYLYKLAGEYITGDPAEFYSNARMDEGHVQEPVARELYEMTTGNVVKEVGFIKSDEFIGYSPDGLVGPDGEIEIKHRDPHIQIDCLLSGKVPTTVMPQLQGGLWVSDRLWVDYVSYNPKLPPFIKRVHRDEDYIKNLSKEVMAFLLELKTIIKKIEAM